MASEAMQQVLAIIERDRQLAGVTADRLDIVAARASLPPTALEMPTGTRVSPIRADDIACVWVVAPQADPDRRIAYFHGGGFVAGGFHSHRSLIGWLSQMSGCAILAVEYSLAPERRYPAQIDEAQRAWVWLGDNGPDGGSRANAQMIAGDSAGAAIAVGMMLNLRDSGGRLPDAAAFFCPMFDLDPATSAFVRSSRRMREIVDAYIGNPDDLRDARASPILADLAAMPALLLQTGAADDARADSELFAQNARAAGVEVTLAVWPEMFHVWQRFAPLLPEATAALAQAGAFLAAQRA